MSGTGKHQEVKSKQNLDGTFEFIVEDSEASDVTEVEVGAEESAVVEAEAATSSSRMMIVAGIAAVVLLCTVALVYALGTQTHDDEETQSETTGFRPYKATGSNVEVPANAPSNEVPVEPEPEELREESAEVVEDEAAAEMVDDPEVDTEDEFVEADEVIGDGEILDGSEEEMLESAQAAPTDMPQNVIKPVIRPENLDMNKISESVRSQIVNGVNPRQIEGIRNLSPAQLRQLEQGVDKELQREQGEAPVE